MNKINLKYERTREELLFDLYTQIKFLKNDCASYDMGDFDYSKRIALSLRVLLHTTKTSTSLLDQLKSSFKFDSPDFLDLSTVYLKYPNQSQETQEFVRAFLCHYYLDNSSPETPPILLAKSISIDPNERYPRRAFKTWWDRTTVVLIDQKYYTRKNIIEYLCNEDGGAHVDPLLSEKLAILKRETAKPLRFLIPKENSTYKTFTAKINQILPASVRTIAEETLYMFNQTVIPYCEKYIKLK